MAPDAPEALAFSNRREDGRFPVHGPDGQAVAHIEVKWTGLSFTATGGAGEPLCAGSARLAGLSSTWTATAADDRPLLSLARSVTGARGEVTLQRGGTFAVRGSVWDRDFVVAADDGTEVLSALLESSIWSFRPEEYAVRVIRPALDLAEVVALVQIWRMANAQGDAAGGVVGAAG